MKVFVTDGDQRPALAIARSLGRRGVSVLVGEEAPTSLASSSKYCVKHVTYPSPRRQPQAFEHALLDIVRREQVDVIMPVTDVTTYSVAMNRDALRHHCAIAAPPFDAFERVTNKWTLFQSAAQCGIPVPRTEFVNGIGGLKEAANRIQYPAVIKPARSRIPTDTGWRYTSVHYAHSVADVWRLYRDVDYLTSYPSLIQERIVGSGTGIFVLCDRGRLLTAFAHTRLREKPPSGGASVLCESIPVNPQLRDSAMRLLGPLGWDGVAMMEYKQDHRTGNVYLMEVNGRFWGSLQLAIDAGVDFPYLHYQLARGQRPDVPAAYRIGARSRWLLGDLDHLLLRLRRTDRDLNLPDTAPSKVRALIDFLRVAQTGLHYDVISGTDPQPFVHELARYAKDLLASSTQGVRSRLSRTPRGRHRFARHSISK